MSAKSLNSNGSRSASARRITAVPPVLRERAAIDEVGVAEMRVPVEIVVDGMVDAAAVFAAEADIERGDAVVLEEGGVVGAGTERGDAQIGALAELPGARSGVCASRDFVKLVALPRGEFRLGIRDVARDFVDEFFEGVRAFDVRDSRGRCRRS